MENRHEAEIISLKKKHASATEIATAEAKNARESADLIIAASLKKQKTEQDELNATKNSIAAKAALLKTQNLSSEAAKKEQEELDKLIKRRGELTTSIKDEQAARDKANNDAAQKDLAVQQAREEAQKQAAERRKQAAEKRRQARDKEYSDQEALDQVDIINTEKNTKARLDAELKLIQDQQAHKIYDAKGNVAQIALLNANAEKDIKAKKQEYQDADEKLRTDGLSFLKKTTDDEITAEKNKTDKEIAQLEDLANKKLITAEELTKDTQKAEQQEAENIKNIKLKAVKEQADQIKKTTEDQYTTEMAMAAGNKQKQSQIQLKEQQDQLAALQKEREKWQKKVDGESPEQANKNGDGAALKQANLDVVNMQNNVSASSLSILQDEYAERIWLAKGNADEIYRLNKKLIDEQITLKEKSMTEEQKKEYENSEEYAQQQGKKSDLDKDYTQKKIDQVKGWADKSMELATQVNSLMKTLGDAEVQKAEDDNNAKKTGLENQLNSGLITKKQYDKQVAASEADLATKKKQIAKDEAIREKAISVFTTIIKTAEGVAANLKTPALIPFIIATGAAELATIIATPLPKARRGLFVRKSNGGLLNGPSHATGGIPIEAEGGEAIINKRSTAMYAPLLSAINEAGGGVKFAGGGVVRRMFADGGVTNTAFTNDGGYSARTQANAITAADMHDAMAAAVSKVKVYTTVEDYRKADSNYTNIVSSGTV
ncbi:MAG: hypothetical protein P4L28_11955 [Paludibacteraceae bacterium]|nr:hypothetical protein [Paludibacteraceae bacterium]